MCSVLHTYGGSVGQEEMVEQTRITIWKNNTPSISCNVCTINTSGDNTNGIPSFVRQTARRGVDDVALYAFTVGCWDVAFFSLYRYLFFLCLFQVCSCSVSDSLVFVQLWSRGLKNRVNVRKYCQ